MSEYRHIANLTGPQGERGPQGQRGPQGEVGPSSHREPIALTTSDNLDTLEPDIYRVGSQDVSNTLGLPGGRLGTLEVLSSAVNARVQVFTTNFGGASTPLEIWSRGTTLDGTYVVDWVQVHPEPNVDGIILDQDADVDNLATGRYRVVNTSDAAAFGLPVDRVGTLEVIRSASNSRVQQFTTNFGGGATPLEIWYRGTTTQGEYQVDWERVFPGPHGLHDPIALQESDSLDDLEPETYRVGSQAAADALETPGGRLGTLEVLQVTANAKVQRFTTNFGGPSTPLEIWHRGTNLAGDYATDWTKVYPPASGASGRIRDLARRDGWLAVYDPSDESTRSVDSAGNFAVIADGLGNLPTLTVPGIFAHGPALLSGEYGQLDGIEAGRTLDGDDAPTFLSATFDAPLEQPNTVMIFGRNTDSTGGEHYLFDTNGGFSTARQNLAMRPVDTNRYAVYAGGTWHGSGYGDTDPHLFTASFDGPRTGLTIDGQQSHYGADGDTTMALNGIRLGQRGAPNGTEWEGTIGPVLIYQGTPPAGAVQRMEKLLLSLSGLGTPQPDLPADTIAYSESSLGKPTFVHGDPNHLLQDGIASMTKLMTVWTARQHLTDSELDDTVRVLENDIHSGPRLRAGDFISYRDLIYAAMVPSDNTAPSVLGRAVGQKIDSETSSPRTRFVEEMNNEAEALGYQGAQFVGTVGTGIMSARQVMDLTRRILADNQLRPTLEAREYTLDIVDGPDPREVPVTHTVFDDSNPPFPDFIAGKTGTFGGRGHLSVAWQHPNGAEHMTVVLNTLTSETNARYQAVRKVITATS